MVWAYLSRHAFARSLRTANLQGPSVTARFAAKLNSCSAPRSEFSQSLHVRRRARPWILTSPLNKPIGRTPGLGSLDSKGTVNSRSVLVIANFLNHIEETRHCVAGLD